MMAKAVAVPLRMVAALGHLPVLLCNSQPNLGSMDGVGQGNGCVRNPPPLA